MTADGFSRPPLEMALDLDASAADVWKALTEGAELQHWFPMEARVRPGPGGSVFLSWGPSCEGEAAIAIWEPGRRFGWVEKHEGRGADEGRTIEISVIFEIEAAAGGRTALRLIQSGFGRDASWNDYYDSVSNGWKFELRSLRHYLTRHAGEDRHTVYIRSKVARPQAELWEILTGPGGPLAGARFDGLGEGDPYRLRTSFGDEYAGTTLIARPPRCFSGTVASLDDALLRIEIETGAGESWPFVWLSAWGGRKAEDAAERFRGRWAPEMRRLFGETLVERR